MATRLRKTRRLRGSRTHGWGRSGQHRESGMLGGHGRAGRFRHKKSGLIGREGRLFGKHGFVPIRKESSSVINVGQLDRLAAGLASRETPKASKTEAEKISLDLTELGYTKLLGTGRVSTPLTVKVVNCSASAREKLEKAGGEVLTPK